jgi:hypothetical protein
MDGINNFLLSKKNNSGVTPSHVIFSDRVHVLPSISNGFSRPLWVTNPAPGFTMRHKAWYEWVAKGEVIESFKVGRGPWFLPFFNHALVPLRSPVSGLLLNVNTTHFDGEHFTEQANTAILLPEGEEIPENAAAVFRDFCQFCDEHRRLFSSSSLDHKLTNAEVDAMLRAQANAPIKIVSAIQEYAGHLQQLKERKPELASRLPRCPQC